MAGYVDEPLAVYVEYDPQEYRDRYYLQTYFQKPSIGGGEVLVVIPNWKGVPGRAVVLFDNDSYTSGNSFGSTDSRPSDQDVSDSQ